MSTMPTPDELETIRTDCENLCRQCAPIDLGSHPVYPVFAHELSEPSDLFWGCTSALLDIAMRPTIGSRWRGRGPCFMVNAQALYEIARRQCEVSGLPPLPRFKMLCLAVGLHEIAHVLADGHNFREASPAASERIVETLVPIFKNFIRRESPIFGTDEVERRDHDERWIRCALHLHHRACATNYWPLLAMQLDVVADLELYGLSPVWKFERAIGDEPARLIGLSIAEILASEPPGEFSKLYTADTDRLKGLQ